MSFLFKILILSYIEVYTKSCLASQSIPLMCLKCLESYSNKLCFHSHFSCLSDSSSDIVRGISLWTSNCTPQFYCCWNFLCVHLHICSLLDNSLRQTVHTDHASVHQAPKLVAALLRVARVTAVLAESNGSLPPCLWLTSPAGWLPRSGIISRTLRSVIEYVLPLPFYLHILDIHSRSSVQLL